jgi:hypothetical protein
MSLGTFKYHVVLTVSNVSGYRQLDVANQAVIIPVPVRHLANLSWTANSKRAITIVVLVLQPACAPIFCRLLMVSCGRYGTVPTVALI